IGTRTAALPGRHASRPTWYLGLGSRSVRSSLHRAPSPLREAPWNRNLELAGRLCRRQDASGHHAVGGSDGERSATHDRGRRERGIRDGAARDADDDVVLDGEADPVFRLPGKAPPDAIEIEGL